MGNSEKEIIDKLKNIVNQIVSLEKQTRESIKKNNGEELEDKLWRSYGTLKFARKISSSEAKTLLSDVMIGKNMGIINTGASLTELMVMSEPAHIAESAGKQLTSAERDKKRAQMLRENI